ncbi:MAG: hypothetical protein ACPG7F_12725 [Aggregatilineales bacterium]
MSKKVYEMQWDCQYCGTKKLLGKTHRYCPHCGGSQHPDARYYPSDDEKIAVQDHIYVGRDRICASCDDLNSAASDFCQQCGASLENAKVADVLNAEKMPDSGYFENSGSRDRVKESFDNDMARINEHGRKKKKNDDKQGLNLRTAVLVALLIGAIFSVFYMLTATQGIDLTVTGHEWAREIQIEKYQTQVVSGWHDSNIQTTLDNASNLGCYEKQRGTITVTYEECHIERIEKGDGTYEEEEVCEDKTRKEPAYDDWCTWTGQRWDYEYSVTTSGVGLSEIPVWGEINLKCEDKKHVGCERAGHRNESYTVLYRGEDRPYRCDFPQTIWESIPVDSEWTGQVGRYNKATIDCKSISLK